MYNLKLTSYPNGSAQIRQYKDPVGSEDKDPYRVKPENKERKELLKVCRALGIVLGDKDELLQNSLARTKRKISEYARCAIWEYFCTLTFDPKHTDRTDFALCMQRVRNWLQNQRQRYAPDIQFLCVPELHTKNIEKHGYCWHVHILMAQTGNMKMSFSGKLTKSGQKIYNLSGWRFGFSTAVPITPGEESIYRIQTYIAKYMTKQAHMLSNGKGSHRYYVSRNLKQPTVKTYFINPDNHDEKIKEICKTLNKKIIWSSESSGYVDIKYHELQ